MVKTKSVDCPACGKNVVRDVSNRWRPFCSERCRLIDLGDWIEERNRVVDPDYLSSENET